MSASPSPLSPEGSETTVGSLSQRLNYMKDHAPSLSAIALKGDGKVNLKEYFHCAIIIARFLHIQ